jgi:hypothetical protein
MSAAFDGDTFDPKLDGPRLSSQLERVRELMMDCNWHSLSYIARKTASSEASVSARLRDFRKAKHGSITVERKRVKESGLWLYRIPNVGETLSLFAGCDKPGNE